MFGVLFPFLTADLIALQPATLRGLNLNTVIPSTAACANAFCLIAKRGTPRSVSLRSMKTSSDARIKSKPRSCPTARSRLRRACSAAEWTRQYRLLRLVRLARAGLIDFGYGHSRVDHTKAEFGKSAAQFDGEYVSWTTFVDND